MPRQPYLTVVGNPSGSFIAVGTRAIRQRPELESLVANCLMAWPNVEAEMAVTLGQLLGAENASALALFNSIRRSSSQRDALTEAAKVSLSDRDLELLSAILEVTKSIESERNALAHGHFGISDRLPDALIWMTTNSYVSIRTEQTLNGPTWDDRKHQNLLQSLFVYRKPDIEKIFTEISELSSLWHRFTSLLREKDETRGGRLYRELCDQPRVAGELVKFRQKKALSIQP